MARPKEFDVDDALQRALEQFWARGYEATSMQDLVAAMGIQKASLYATFGDKRSLYLRALRRYQQKALADLTAQLCGPGSPTALLCGTLRGLAGASCAKNGRRGCFCVNANIELAAHDAEVAEMLQGQTRAVEQLLAQTLARAQAAGELPADADGEALAGLLYGVMLALNVLARQGSDAERMLRLVEQGLRSAGLRCAAAG